jgi:hypothetical protein
MLSRMGLVPSYSHTIERSSPLGTPLPMKGLWGRFQPTPGGLALLDGHLVLSQEKCQGLSTAVCRHFVADNPCTAGLLIRISIASIGHREL